MTIHIGFEGPIAAGKTTLANLMANHIGAKLVLEDVDGNEFLADFYKDRARWSLAMQLWFLATRHDQLSQIPCAEDNFVVADYTYAKEAVFAQLLLNDRELRLYNQITAGLTANVAKPDLVVYLDAENDVLLSRIEKRGRSYEASINTEYLESVRQAYERKSISNYATSFLRFDTTHLDINSDIELSDLYRRILSAVPRK